MKEPTPVCFTTSSQTQLWVLHTHSSGPMWAGPPTVPMFRGASEARWALVTVMNSSWGLGRQVRLQGEVTAGALAFVEQIPECDDGAGEGRPQARVWP